MEDGPPGLTRRTPISVDPADTAPAQEAIPAPVPAPRPRRARRFAQALRHRAAGLSRFKPLLIAWGIPLVLAAGGAGMVVHWARINPGIPDQDPTAGGVRATMKSPPGAPGAGGGLLNPPGCGVGTEAALDSAQGEPDAAGGPMPMPSGGEATFNPPGFPGMFGESGSEDTGGPAEIPAPSSSPRPSRGAAPPPGAAAPSAPGSWPRYRGADFTNVSKDSGGYASQWPSSGPKQLWKVTLGEGHAGAAVSDGKVYVLDYDHAAQADTLRCFSLAGGKQIWKQGYPVAVKRNHGMSRTVPAVSGKYVVTIGPMCHVMCADANTGTVYWRKDLVKEYGTKVPTWYAGQCPLIDGGKVILAPGGKALMIAADLASGKVLWKTPNFAKQWEMTHSSIVPMTHKGTKMYLYCGSGGVAGVSAKDGSILWSTTDWTVSTANIPVPIPVGDGKIFLCGGYNAGSMMLKLSGNGPKFKPETVFRLPAKVFGSDQQSPILYKGNIYGVIPGGQLACIDLQGKQKWTSGSTTRFGLGPYVIAGDLLYVLSDKGELALVQPNPSKYTELARARVLEGHDAWAPIAVAGGKLLLRDLTTMVCLDVGAS